MKTADTPTPTPTAPASKPCPNWCKGEHLPPTRDYRNTAPLVSDPPTACTRR